jgi:hypothetical protein
MIQVLIEMADDGQSLQIKTDAVGPVALAVVTSAYHELLSRKIQADFDSSVRVARRLPDNGRRN